MKIAILSCFYPFRGGISQFNACLYDELSKEHVVKAFNFKRQYPEFLFPGKTQFVTEDDEAVPVESTSLLDTANPFSYISTYRAIRDWKPDVLIVRYWMSYFGPSLGYITRKMKKHCKVISILDNVIPHEPHFFDAPLTRYFLKGSTGCVTLCEAVSKDLLELKPDARYTVIQHPLYSHFGARLPREEAEEKLGLEKGKKNILFFGLIRTYKGLDILLEAFGMLPDGYQLIVAGEPYGSFDRYQEIIDRLPNRDRIYTDLKYIRDSAIAIGTLESYVQMKEYFGVEKLLPLYIEVDDGVRLERALKRERKQDNPKYEEMCRRFLADAKDFSEENLIKAGITKRYQNIELEKCIEEIMLGIKENL